MVTVEEHRQRQAEHLKALRERLGLKRITLADRLGFEDSQGYALYERAKSIIRLDQTPRWAEAFDVPLREFLEEVVIKAADAAQMAASEPYSPRAELEASGVVPDDYIEKLVADLYERSEADQRAVVESTIRHYREAHRQTGAG
jgi:transcriptional regulator with XRE-family HTH domain